MRIFSGEQEQQLFICRNTIGEGSLRSIDPQVYLLHMRSAYLALLLDAFEKAIADRAAVLKEFNPHYAEHFLRKIEDILHDSDIPDSVRSAIPLYTVVYEGAPLNGKRHAKHPGLLA